MTMARRFGVGMLLLGASVFGACDSSTGKKRAVVIDDAGPNGSHDSGSPGSGAAGGRGGAGGASTGGGGATSGGAGNGGVAGNAGSGNSKDSGADGGIVVQSDASVEGG